MDETVGITEYLHPELNSITGILKQRFSDFIVREVTVEDEVVHLHDINGEELERRIFAKEKNEEICEDNTSGETFNSLEDKFLGAMCKVYNLAQDALICSSSSNDVHSGSIDSLKSFIAQCESKDAECPVEWIGFPTTEKQIRSVLHGKVREVAGNLLDSTTVTIAVGEGTITNMSYLKLLAKHKMKGGNNGNNNNGGKGQAAFVNNNRKRKFDNWPEKECGGNYLEFTMMKENIDTMSAINVLSKHLHTKPEYILYNGTKDKRGITTQKVTIYRRKPSDFKKINSYPHQPTIRIGDFRYVATPAKLGNLHGNRFEITLRAVQCVATASSSGASYDDDKTIELACEYLKTHGFINYFGLQRFGKGGSKSHEIGKSIFKSNWQECVNMMFTPRDGDRENVKVAKDAFFNRRYDEALRQLPEAMYAEKCVLKKLLVNGDDWQSAYHAIGNKGSRLICAHAYQSYIFNLAASKRVTEFGLSIVEGDLVILNESALISGAVDDEDIEPSTADANTNDDQQAVKKSNQNGGDENDAKKEDFIHIVTDEDVKMNKFSLDQLVLPLCGSESILPKNTIGEFITNLLARDGMSLETFGKCFPTYRMRGDYRKVIQRPRNVEWLVQRYSDPNAELAETELNKFRSVSQDTKNSSTTVGSSVDTDNSGTKIYKALQLKFTLPPGTYATMLLREVTKQSTESEYQAQLTANVRTAHDS